MAARIRVLPRGSAEPAVRAILQTTDGGRTFTAIRPAGPLTSAPVHRYSQIRFADANNGFAYGPNLYATHDGGRPGTRSTSAAR